jgi:aconitate hydratase
MPEPSRPLTYAEKILGSHVRGPADAEGYADFAVDRVALQDALAQIVALQFMVAGLRETVVPTTVHCDHLVQARTGARADLESARASNAEVYEFLRNVCAKYGIDFWEPGSGIIHQVVLEHYAVPGQLMVGTDSHTPNAGGLGMIAIGVGGGDAIDAMTTGVFNLRRPRLIGVHLHGALSGWTSPKDVILKVAEILTVKGGTGAIVEYFGPGVRSITATGRATICNMGAEIGATTSIFPCDEQTVAYLAATGRAAPGGVPEMRADPEVEAEPERFFDRVIDIDLDALVPMINGPDSPDCAHLVGEVAAWARGHDVPVEVSAALVGSCTNSSYEDLTRAASVARAAAAHGLRARVPLYVTPGSEQIRATVERDGVLADLEAIGATVLANACGPCIGQWDRPGIDPATPNTIVTSFNRNFPKRNDGNVTTKSFLASPEMVVAYAVAGTLDFDPRDHPELGVPSGVALPPRGFARGDVVVSPDSERLQLLSPFPAWDGADFVELPLLLKARGKCTTDHISAAGRWLRYRGHLENISGNLFLGARNAFTGAVGEGRDPLDGVTKPFPDIARNLSEHGVRWCVVGDENYGEGSSREHAAMEPRYRGCAVVFARSFARIHETNLKKQGLLPLVFADPSTYDEIEDGDRLSVLDVASLAAGDPVTCRITKRDRRTIDFTCVHSLSERQLAWFRAGSALNVIRAQAATGV